MSGISFQIKDSLDKMYADRWQALAEAQAEIFLGKEGDLMRRQAARMADTFSLDTMEQLVAKVERSGERRAESCVVCGKEAGSRCSRCRRQRYCGRQCQLDHWQQHKLVCTK